MYKPLFAVAGALMVLEYVDRNPTCLDLLLGGAENRRKLVRRAVGVDRVTVVPVLCGYQDVSEYCADDYMWTDVLKRRYGFYYKDKPPVSILDDWDPKYERSLPSVEVSIGDILKSRIYGLIAFVFGQPSFTATDRAAWRATATAAGPSFAAYESGRLLTKIVDRDQRVAVYEFMVRRTCRMQNRGVKCDNNNFEVSRHPATHEDASKFNVQDRAVFNAWLLKTGNNEPYDPDVEEERLAKEGVHRVGGEGPSRFQP